MLCGGIEGDPSTKPPAQPTSQAFLLPSSLAAQSRGALLLQMLSGSSLLDLPPAPPTNTHTRVPLQSFLPEMELRVPTSPASLTFIVLLGGDTEETQDVYCGISPTWWRAPVHCGRVRQAAGRVWGLPAPLPGRPHTALQPCAFNLNSSRGPMSEGRARGVGSGTSGQPGPYTVSLGLPAGLSGRVQASAQPACTCGSQAWT